MLCGNGDRIAEVLRFKSNMDSGMFLPLQLAAVKGLSLEEDWHDALNEMYKERREQVSMLLHTIGCTYDTSQAGLFVWAKIPGHYKDGFDLSDHLLKEARVFITPGGIFGSEGSGYIRVSLCGSVEKITEAITRIKGIPV
jgi:aspartate/methionine/tyrosine aminotransferase